MPILYHILQIFFIKLPCNPAQIIPILNGNLFLSWQNSAAQETTVQDQKMLKEIGLTLWQIRRNQS